MTDKSKDRLSKISIVLGIIVVLGGFVASMVSFTSSMTRALDLSTQTAKTVEALSHKLETESEERIIEDKILADAIIFEREERKTDNSKTMVKLAEIDTKLFYIQQGQDQIINFVNGEKSR